MGSTPTYQLPYPELTDPPDGPAQIKALALATESALKVSVWPGTVVLFYQQSAVQQIQNGTPTPIIFDKAYNWVDRLNGMQPSRSRYIPTLAGYYVCSGVFAFVGNATGQRWGGITQNNNSNLNSSWTYMQNAGTSIAAFPVPTVTIGCNGTTDYIELQATQNSGNPLNTNYTGSLKSTITITYAGPFAPTLLPASDDLRSPEGAGTAHP